MANPIRNAMVYLGLADEEAETAHEQPQQARQTAPAASATSQPRAAVTPIRRAPAQPSAEMNEILTVHARAFKDVQVIAEHFREGVPVIINISQMTDAEARRLIDFTCGLAEALYGHIERVTGKVFLLSPSHVAVSGEQGELDSDVDASFFAGV